MILGVRACVFTIRHHGTNQTDSQNAGALGQGVRIARKSAHAVGDYDSCRGRHSPRSRAAPACASARFQVRTTAQVQAVHFPDVGNSPGVRKNLDIIRAALTIWLRLG